ncbi:MAG TPA: hypothetical protein VKE51_24410 [Vicinamibacterales bacterium]|nr:hypothetical protein [Vicinamibacterales bacterium]
MSNLFISYGWDESAVAKQVLFGKGRPSDDGPAFDIRAGWRDMEHPARG